MAKLLVVTHQEKLVAKGQYVQPFQPLHLGRDNLKEYY
jgi:hypothetical protein